MVNLQSHADHVDSAVQQVGLELLLQVGEFLFPASQTTGQDESPKKLTYNKLSSLWLSFVCLSYEKDEAGEVHSELQQDRGDSVYVENVRQWSLL